MSEREHLFKGKRVDNGEWVEGFYAKAKNVVTDKEETFILPIDGLYFTHGEFCYYPVLPETVCEFINLTDKNGKKIFEGDIVQCEDDWDRSLMFVEFDRIGYDSGAGLTGFAFSYTNYTNLKDFKYPKTKKRRSKNYFMDCDRNIDLSELEVIGNIHDKGANK